MSKPFKTFEEQIDILKDEGLSINGQQSWNRLYENLKKFNMQELIDGYNDPFFEDYDRSKSYKPNVNSDMIIDFFEFEKDIANLLIKTIWKIETQLNTSICHEILRKMSPYNIESIFKLRYRDMIKIFNPNEKFLLNVNFQNLFKKNSYVSSCQNRERILKLNGNTVAPTYIRKTNTNNYEIRQKQNGLYSAIPNFETLNVKELVILNELKLESIKGAENHSIVIWRKRNRSEKIEDMALYVISLSWTFGKTNQILKYLKNSIKNDIISNYFKTLSNLKIESFVLVLEILRLIRNKISHNNVIYNIDYFKLVKEIYPRSSYNLSIANSDIFSKLNINPYNGEIRLLQIVSILNKMMPDDNIYNLFQFKLANLKDRLDSNSFDYIKSKLGII